MKSSPASAALAGNVPEEHVESTATRSPQSASNTPTASPPLFPDKSLARSFVPDSIPPLNTPRSNQAVPGDSPSHANTPKSFSRPLPPQRPKVAPRTSSKGGGVQVVLDGEGDWSALAEQNLTLPADALEGVIAREGKGGSSGMLGFLNRKKGRDRSPKPKDPGIIGKFGARQILNPN
jgi:serine/threonine kinase 32